MLSWQPPTEREDGSPLGELSGYRIYYGTESRSYFGTVEIEEVNIVNVCVLGPPQIAPENGVHVHDLNATILHLLGIDHRQLTYRYQGRDFRLTDVHGHVLHDLIA